MSQSYRHKGHDELIFDANVKRIRLEGRIILDEVMNEALKIMSDRFQEARLNGTVLELDGNKELLKEFLLEASKRELESGQRS